MANKITGYELSRDFWDWAFVNPEKIKPVHSAIYFFAIEHNNRLGWREMFGFPSQMAMDAVGIKNGRTYRKALDDLEEFGFITFIERSKNQYSANIIALSKNTLALDNALDNAMIKHYTKQVPSTIQGTAPITKPLNQEHLNQEQETKELHEKSIQEARSIAEFFSIREVSQHRTFVIIVEFCKWAILNKKIDLVKKQFKAYSRFKVKSKQEMHGVKKYIGEAPDYNGAWNECDWTGRLDSYSSTSSKPKFHKN